MATFKTNHIGFIVMLVGGLLFITNKLTNPKQPNPSQPTPTTPTTPTNLIPNIQNLFLQQSKETKQFYKVYFLSLATTIENSTKLQTTTQIRDLIKLSVQTIPEITQNKYPRLTNLDTIVNSEFYAINNGEQEQLTPELRKKFVQKARDIAASSG